MNVTEIPLSQVKDALSQRYHEREDRQQSHRARACDPQGISGLLCALNLRNSVLVLHFEGSSALPALI